MTYSFPNLEPVCHSMSSSNCCFLTCIQISQEPGQVVWYSHLCKDFPQFVVIHTVKDFGFVVNKAEVDVFLEFSWFFFDPTDVGNFITGSSAFLKSSLNLCNFSVHVLLKPSLENFENFEWGPREAFWWLQLQRVSDYSLMRDSEPDHPAKLLPDYWPSEILQDLEYPESSAEAWVGSGLLLG